MIAHLKSCKNLKLLFKKIFPQVYRNMGLFHWIFFSGWKTKHNGKKNKYLVPHQADLSLLIPFSWSPFFRGHGNATAV